MNAQPTPCSALPFPQVIPDGRIAPASAVEKPLEASLFATIEFNDVEQLEKLFTQGLDVNAVDSDGSSVLIRAVEEELYEVTRAVCQNSSINVNYRRPSDGYSALMIAAANGHPKIVQQLLLCPGIDLSLENNEGKTAMELAKLNQPHADENNDSWQLISHSDEDDDNWRLTGAPGSYEEYQSTIEYLLAYAAVKAAIDAWVHTTSNSLNNQQQKDVIINLFAPLLAATQQSEGSSLASQAFPVHRFA